MFTIHQLQEANLKVQNGEDFPSYVQELIRLGVISYDTFVTDGHTSYVGDNHFKLNAKEKYPNIEISDKADSEKFKTHLKAHQQGQTHYLSFCKHAAQSGIDKWTVNTHAMTCTYFDKKGNTVLTESIPSPKKAV